MLEDEEEGQEEVCVEVFEYGATLFMDVTPSSDPMTLSPADAATGGCSSCIKMEDASVDSRRGTELSNRWQVASITESSVKSVELKLISVSVQLLEDRL